MNATTYEVSDDVAILTFNTKGPVNALSRAVVAEFGERVEQFLADPAARGIVIASAKSDFIVGADLTMITDLDSPQGDREELLKAWSALSTALRRLETGGKPAVAAINGSALGGGYEIALACHRRFVADDPSIRLGLPETDLAMMPAAGGTQRLPRMVGAESACELILSGARLAPEESVKRGLIDEIVVPEALLQRATDWVREKSEARQPWDAPGFVLPGVAVQSPQGMHLFERLNAVGHTAGNDYSPHIPAVLTAVYRGSHVAIDAGLRVESKQHLKLLLENVSPRRLVRTEFFGVRALRKQASRPNEPVQSFTKIGVVGAGMMGSGIAQIAVEAELNVVLIDLSAEALAAAHDKLEQLWQKQVSRGKLSPYALQQRLDRIETASNVTAASSCDLIIEAVNEVRELKHKVLAQIAEAAPNAVIATNTSSLPVTELAIAVTRPERFIGLHFVSPVHRMLMVELIRGANSGPVAIAAGFDFIKKVRKIAMPVGDGPAFFGTRLFRAFVEEGVALVAEGVPAAVVENAARQAGFRTGPLEVLDEVTLSLFLEAGSNNQDSIEQPSTQLLRSLVDRGRVGRQTLGGFYDYPVDEKKYLWTGLADLADRIDAPQSWNPGDFEDAPRQLSAYAGRRMMLAAALDAVRAREAGVIDDVGTADVGSVMAGMFPRHTGGCFSFLDDFGLSKAVEQAEALGDGGRPAFEVPESLRTLAAKGGAWHQVE